jgi:hypothetical protein
MKTLSKLQSELTQLEGKKKYNRTRIFKNAYHRVKKTGCSFSEALKESWKAAKAFRVELKHDINHVIVEIRRLYEVEIPSALCVEHFNKDMENAHSRGIKIY